MNRFTYLYRQFLFILIILSSFTRTSIADSKNLTLQCSSIFASEHQQKQLVDDPVWEQDLLDHANKRNIYLQPTDVNLETLYLLLKSLKFSAVVAGQLYLVTSKKENLEFFNNHFKTGVTEVSPLLSSLEFKNEFLLAANQLLARPLSKSEQSKLWITYLSFLPESRENIEALRLKLGHDVFMRELRFTLELMPTEVDKKLSIIMKESEAEIVFDLIMDRLADLYSATMHGDSAQH